MKALQDDSIQLAVIYSADPVLGSDDLVSLADPKGLFLASHVVPVASDKLDEQAVKIISGVTAQLSPAGLIALNAQSTQE